MPTITDANYPTEDGWNHIEIALKPGEPMNEDEKKQLLCFFIGGFEAKPEDYEIVIGEEEDLVFKGVIRLAMKKQPLELHSLEGKSWVSQCEVCGERYENGSGSTPCCGARQFIVTLS